MPVSEAWSLAGKTAAITGDERGWTPYLASALAEAGADIVAAGPAGSDFEKAAEAAEERGRRALAVEADLTVEADVQQVIDTAVTELGGLDILVNNARVEFTRPFLDLTEAEWDAVMDLNVKSMFLCCRAAGRHMLANGGGRIVNIGTGLAERGLWNSAVACASQGAVRQLTAALGLEWARHNIRVSAIGAGWVTPDRTAEGHPQDALERYIPSRRKGHPEDLCGLLVYLCSDASDFVTGHMLYVDGGALAHA